MNGKTAFILAAVLAGSLLAGCRQAEQPPAEGPEPMTAQELLAEQPVDETHDAFLVDTGGRLGTLLVTAELGAQDLSNELAGFDITISVWNPQSMDAPLQTMGAEVWEMVFGHHNVIDANFDGHQDFGYQYTMGVQSEGWYYWIWDEDLGQFVEVPEFRNISSPTFDAERQVISGRNRNSAAGDGLSTFHRWLDGELVCVREIHVYSDSFETPFILTVRDRIGGELTEVYRTEFPPFSDGYFAERVKWENLEYHGEPETAQES